MQDYFNEMYEWDEDGKRKRKRVAGDGERITFATISDHAAYGFSKTFSDGSRDFTDPYRPGYRFLDVDDAGRIAAQEAYDARSKRLSENWRRKDQQQQSDDTKPRTPFSMPGVSHQQGKAQDAYREKCTRLDFRSRRSST